MKIAVIQASSQKEKNTLVYDCVLKAVKDQKFEVINFGVFPEESATFLYRDIPDDKSVIGERSSRFCRYRMFLRTRDDARLQ